jgi:hypothetical protein
MALPGSRDTTYAPLQQVKSSDLNNWQDQIIVIRGEREAQFSYYQNAFYTAAPLPDVETIQSVGWTSPGNKTLLQLPIFVRANDRIKKFSTYVVTNGTGGQVEIYLERADMTGVAVSPVAGPTSVGSGFLEHDFGGTPHLVASDNLYLVRIATTGAGAGVVTLSSVKVTFDDNFL